MRNTETRNFGSGKYPRWQAGRLPYIIDCKNQLSEYLRGQLRCGAGLGADKGGDLAGAAVDFVEGEVLEEAHAERRGEGIARSDGVDDLGGKAGVVGGFVGRDEQTPLASSRVGDEAEIEHPAEG